MPPMRSVGAEPGFALLFFLLLAPLVVLLELLLGESFCAALCLETAAVVAVCSGIYVEEGMHLPFAFILVVVELRSLASLLELACEAVKLSGSCVVMSRSVWCVESGSSSRFCLLLFLGGFPGVVCVRIVAAMDCGIVSTPLAPGRTSSRRTSG